MEIFMNLTDLKNEHGIYIPHLRLFLFLCSFICRRTAFLSFSPLNSFYEKQYPERKFFLTPPG